MSQDGEKTDFVDLKDVKKRSLYPSFLHFQKSS